MFLPILLLLPLKVITAWLGNRRMDAFFLKHGLRLRPIAAGQASEGFVFTPLDVGNKVVHVRLLSGESETEFVFNITVAGLAADYLRRDFQDMYPPDQLVECDLATLRQTLIDMPKAVSNGSGMRHGDPVNLVVVGEFPVLIANRPAGTKPNQSRWRQVGKPCAFSRRGIPLFACQRALPVRTQPGFRPPAHPPIDQRAAASALWTTPLRLSGTPVWVGQISRDIGVRFTLKTWNLTTHRIDPDVDEGAITSSKICSKPSVWNWPIMSAALAAAMSKPSKKPHRRHLFHRWPAGDRRGRGDTHQAKVYDARLTQ